MIVHLKVWTIVIMRLVGINGIFKLSQKLCLHRPLWNNGNKQNIKNVGNIENKVDQKGWTIGIMRIVGIIGIFGISKWC